MLLNNLSYLSDASTSGSARALGFLGGLRKQVWVLPRSWCATTSIRTTGVPRHNTAAFVRLHLNRLAPFVDSGTYACRTGDVVHFWFWENQRVRELCQQHNLDFDTIELVPESICFPKLKEGAVLYRCKEGVEAQLWHKGQLIDSAWWPDVIDTSTWANWLASEQAALAGRDASVRWPESLPPLAALSNTVRPGITRLQKPWARNVLGKQWWQGLKEVRLGMATALAAIVMTGFAGYLSAKWLMLDRMQNSVEKKIAVLSPKVDPLQAKRTKALEYQQWTTQVAKLGTQPGIRQVLEALRPTLVQQDALIREFEYTDGEIRVMLVPLGTELNLASLVQQFEVLPGLYNVQLLPNSDSHSARLSARLRIQAMKVPAHASDKPSIQQSSPTKESKQTPPAVAASASPSSKQGGSK